MQWTDYMKVANGIYIPEPNKPYSNRNKLVIAEGLSSKNLLKMPGKLSEPQVSMESDLRRFITGKPILSEVAVVDDLAVAGLVAGAAEAAGVGVSAAGAGAATTGVAGATGAVAGESAAAGAAGSAGASGAASLAADAPESSLAGKAWDVAQSAVANTNIDSKEDESGVKDKSGL